VSREFTLNAAQHTAFVHGATALLHSLVERLALSSQQQARLLPHMRCLPFAADQARRQLLMCLTGAGGTGKSEVVKALREFAQSWGIADALCVTATTGIAACIVHGLTWHKATGHFSFVRGGKATGVRDKWKTVSLLIVDEILMMSARQLAQLSEWLGILKGKPEELFGGLHIIFSGDFFQLPPVLAHTVYDDGSGVDGEAALGRDLWARSVNSAVILSENHRARHDPAFAELLRVLREGTDDAALWQAVIGALETRRRGVAGGGAAGGSCRPNCR
jgi:hypothetical protein